MNNQKKSNMAYGANTNKLYDGHVLGYLTILFFVMIGIVAAYNAYLRVFTYSDAWFDFCLYGGAFICAVYTLALRPSITKRLAELKRRQAIGADLQNVTGSTYEIDVQKLTFWHTVITFLTSFAFFMGVVLFPVGAVLHKLTMSKAVLIDVSGRVDSCRISRFSYGFHCLDIVNPTSLVGLSGVKIYESDAKVAVGQQVTTAKIYVSQSWFGSFSDRYQGLGAKDIQLGPALDDAIPDKNIQQSGLKKEK